MSDIALQKVAARKAAFARRAAVHSPEASRAGARNLMDFLQPHRGRPISGYMPIRTEIDPLPAMAEMARHGPVGVPIVMGDGKPLEFHLWDTDMPMVLGAFGAAVPVTAEVMLPSVIILPLVAFDRTGRRLGYGGGFYDRTLAALSKRGPVLAVGYAYSAQEADDLPAEATDHPLDAVVTETEIFTF